MHQARASLGRCDAGKQETGSHARGKEPQRGRQRWACPTGLPNQGKPGRGVPVGHLDGMRSYGHTRTLVRPSDGTRVRDVPIRGVGVVHVGNKLALLGQKALSCGEMWGTVGHMQRRLLTGTHECSLDNRFRLAIPARLREAFLGGAVVGWWIDECLIVVPRGEWAGLIERTFGSMSVLDDEGRELSRFLSAGAFEQDLDRQGRILLPTELREHAGLASRVKVVGAGEYLEVWDGDRLSERFAALRREGVSARAKRLADRVG